MIKNWFSASVPFYLVFILNDNKYSNFNPIPSTIMQNESIKPKLVHIQNGVKVRERIWSREAQPELHIPHQGFDSSDAGQAISGASARQPAGASLLPHRPWLHNHTPPEAHTIVRTSLHYRIPRGSSGPAHQSPRKLQETAIELAMWPMPHPDVECLECSRLKPWRR